MDKNDLISRSALKDAFWADTDNTLHYTDSAEYELIMLEIDEAPAVDPDELRPRGKWIHLGGDEWCCNHCCFVISTEGSWEKPNKKFCEECGAKMER